THTSGIPDYTTAPRFRERDARLAHSLDDLINLVRDKPLDFEPGSKMAYNNMGYVLLAYTIEKVSKQTYADYLRAHIFGPLGMRNTGVASSVTIIPKLASGYSAGRGGVVNASPVDMSNFTGPGALYSTVDDLLIWDQALYAGKVLNAASSTAMFADYGHNYGFGWQVDRKWDRDRVWHSGDINGFSTMFQRYPMDRVTVVALSNYDGSFPGRIATDLAGLCLGFPLPVYRPEVSLSIINLDHFVGDYQYAPGVIFKVVRDGPRLKALVEGSGPVPLYPMSPSEFFAKLVDAHMIFQID